MTTIEALRLKIDNLQVESQQVKSQGLKLQLERDQYKEENEQLTVLYEELLKKMRKEMPLHQWKVIELPREATALSSTDQ